MARAISTLSIDEIRERFAGADRTVSPQLLNQLKRDSRHGVRQIYEVLKNRYERQRAERLRLDGMLNFERVLWRSGVERIAGVDEAGTGPLAGPVVAAAVVFAPHTELPGVDDSKRLDPEQREAAERTVRSAAVGIGIGCADVGEVDSVNVYQAALLAMRRAVEALPVLPQHVLVDARVIPNVDVPQNRFYKGDGINFSIAAASIIAKTHRDRLMSELAQQYPEYGFAKHKGYGTAEHQDAIRRFGPCPIHRMSFPFIREICGEFSALFYELKHRLEAAGVPAALIACEQEVAARRTDLAEHELGKLRVMISRRWKTF